MSLIDSNLRVCVRCAVTKAKIIVSFKVNCFRDISLVSGWPLRWLRTIWGFHVSTYLGKVGFLLKAPDIKREIIGCSPALKPSILMKEERALLVVPRAL